MKKLGKFFAVTALAACLSTAVFAGCGSVGRDGRNGRDVTIQEVWEATNAERVKEGLDELSFLDFVKEYLDYTSDEKEQLASKQSMINRSLLSSVSILAEFYTGMSKSTYAGAGVIVYVNRDEEDANYGQMYVVTNCHVVYEASTNTSDWYSDAVYMYLYGDEYYTKREIKAEIVGASKTYDIAVLKVANAEGRATVARSDAAAAKWSYAEETYLGESVYAIGNPEGEKMSVISGIISKDSEDITVNLGSSKYPESYTYRVMRTDAAINGGNSGGGLFNDNGEVVGIVNAKTISSKIDNMGYALPSSTVRRVVDNIIENYDGNESHGISVGDLGNIFNVDDGNASYNPETNLTELYERVTVGKIPSSSRAYGKLLEGDIINRIQVITDKNIVREDIPVKRKHNISDALISVRPGYKVNLFVDRNGANYTATIEFPLGYLVGKP